MKGGGKYDAEVTALLKSTNAALVVAMIVGGDRGNGFSVQTIDAALLHQLPSILRQMADGIAADLGHGQG